MKVKRFVYWRRLMAGILLLVSLLKLHDLVMGVAQSEPPDPVTGAPLWVVSSLGAAAEFCVASLIVFGPLKSSAYSLLFLGSIFTAHGVLLAVYGVSRCPCLGSRFPWQWLDVHETQVALSLALWMFFSSVFWLFAERRFS